MQRDWKFYSVDHHNIQRSHNPCLGTENVKEKLHHTKNHWQTSTVKPAQNRNLSLLNYFSSPMFLKNLHKKQEFKNRK
jgi:hypothetical protein